MPNTHLRQRKIKNNISISSYKDMSIKEVTKVTTLDRIEWRKIIYVADLD